MKVLFSVEVSGLEHWGLSQDQATGKDSDYWDEIKNDIKDFLQDGFGREHISITHKLEA
jgi:hypothetical protein